MTEAILALVHYSFIHFNNVSFSVVMVLIFPNENKHDSKGCSVQPSALRSKVNVVLQPVMKDDWREGKCRELKVVHSASSVSVIRGWETGNTTMDGAALRRTCIGLIVSVLIHVVTGSPIGEYRIEYVHHQLNTMITQETGA